MTDAGLPLFESDASPPGDLRPGRTSLRRGALARHDLTHGGSNVARFIAASLLGMLFPLFAALLLYGWRAAAAVVIVIGSAMLTGAMWRAVGSRGGRLRLDTVAWLSVLLALTLPAHLLSSSDPVGRTGVAAWPILVAGGATLAIFVWLLGGTGSGRIHPVIIVHLLLFALFADMLAPQFALRREHVLRGDVLNAPAFTSLGSAPGATLDPWRKAWMNVPPDRSPYEAQRSVAPGLRLEQFTGGHEAPERSWISLESLVRDRLPPLEDLIVGGQPAPIGQGSAIAIIVGGLFLLYRGVIDYRVPAVLLLSALVALLILPVPVVITDRERILRWLVMREPGVGAALAVTFANYELLASPLLFTAFFLATSPAVRPLSRRARVVYGSLVGVTAAAFQLYVSVTIGPYLALLGISLLTPMLDRMFRPRTLV
jgi:Na+-translocating ferredoxin:NAD+ oxidoreductase RnfD subunit